jgi:peptidoglycan/xylan/chitin deacetylase (PgdA/CDA1 family)
VGCHTFSHPNVRRLNRRDLAGDLDKNAAYLSEALPGLKARNFAFPYNLASPLARRAPAGRFCSCRGSWEGINRGSTDAGYLKSVEICPSQVQHNRTIRWIERCGCFAQLADFLHP